MLNMTGSAGQSGLLVPVFMGTESTHLQSMEPDSLLTFRKSFLRNGWLLAREHAEVGWDEAKSFSKKFLEFD